MGQSKKGLIFIAGSRRDLSEMPEKVRKDFGGALHGVQEGWKPTDAKMLKGKAAGAIQLSEDDDGETYRAVYTVELEDTVYVLHCFHKKGKKGAETPKKEIDVIEQRLKMARMLHAQRKGLKDDET